MRSATTFAVCATIVAGSGVVFAQTRDPGHADGVHPPAQAQPQFPGDAQVTTPMSLAEEPEADRRRACEACPRRSVGRAFLDATLINGLYEAANLARGQVTARITPKTWWANMQQGWVWDLDDFQVNQVGHPYQGNNYFNAGRSNGLSFYESAAITAFGSATWEYFGETNKPSLNDFINTTLGGIALGEMFHRVAWLVRDTRATGRGRLWREIGATAIDPVTGANRFISGDASRVSAPPEDRVPSDVTAVAAAGVLWRGTDTTVSTATGEPFLELDLLYGDVKAGSSRTPFDAFSARLRFGGGSAFSEARVRGRLLGHAVGGGPVHLGVLQTYDYQENGAFQTGSQSIDGAISFSRRLSPSTHVWLLGWAGLTVLGAVDSLPPGVTERPEREPGSQGQGVSEGPRFYDYGPGTNFGGVVQFARGSRPFAMFSYEGRHLYSIDGVRANHFLQRTRLDVLAPLRGSLGLGASAEYFNRHTFFVNEQDPDSRYRFPQVRAYLVWSFE